MQITNSNRNQLKVGQIIQMECPDNGVFNANLQVVSIRQSKKYGLRIQVKAIENSGILAHGGTIVDFEHKGVFFYA